MVQAQIRAVIIKNKGIVITMLVIFQDALLDLIIGSDPLTNGDVDHKPSLPPSSNNNTSSNVSVQSLHEFFPAFTVHFIVFIEIPTVITHAVTFVDIVNRKYFN